MPTRNDAQPDLFAYPRSAGYKEETTSRDAAVAIEVSGRAETLRETLERYFRQGLVGTADEMAAILNASPFSVRPRVTELYKRGIIIRAGYRALSDNGRLAHVYKLAT